jgi:hypothetical protein
VNLVMVRSSLEMRNVGVNASPLDVDHMAQKRVITQELLECAELAFQNVSLEHNVGDWIRLTDT